MISVAPNVLADIGRRAEKLRQTLLTPGTRGLPGYDAYANALKARVSTGVSSEATSPAVSPPGTGPEKRAKPRRRPKP